MNEGYLQYDWRVLPMETHTAAENMALDEACAVAMAQRKVKPTIRFYRWNPSAVSIGYFQSLNAEVNLSACKEKKVDVVRRRTGGGAVYHDYAGEVTYSVIAPEQGFESNIVESYRQVANWIIDALSTLHVKGEFSPINDIVVNGKKISGNAQTRRSGILQMHGTILWDVDVDRMFSLLNVPDEKMRGKTIQTVKERVTSLKNNGINSYEEAYHALHSRFVHGKKWHEGKWTPEELENATILSREKYGSEKWNGQR